MPSHRPLAVVPPSGHVPGIRGTPLCGPRDVGVARWPRILRKTGSEGSRKRHFSKGAGMQNGPCHDDRDLPEKTSAHLEGRDQGAAALRKLDPPRSVSPLRSWAADHGGREALPGLTLPLPNAEAREADNPRHPPHLWVPSEGSSVPQVNAHVAEGETEAFAARANASAGRDHAFDAPSNTRALPSEQAAISNCLEPRPLTAPLGDAYSRPLFPKKRKPKPY